MALYRKDAHVGITIEVGLLVFSQVAAICQRIKMYTEDFLTVRERLSR
jgi:hypothetical protein